MESLEFNKCCFCIDLRLGCLIIGYTSAISSLVMFPLELVSMLKLEDLGSKTFLVVSAVNTLVVSVVCLVASIFLLIGLHKEKSSSVKIYLIITGIILVFSVGASCIQLALAFTVLNVISQIIQILLAIYAFLVVRSYYVKMPEGE